MKETILAYSLSVGLEGEQPIETGPPSEQAIFTPLFAMAGSGYSSFLSSIRIDIQMRIVHYLIVSLVEQGFR